MSVKELHTVFKCWSARIIVEIYIEVEIGESSLVSLPKPKYITGCIIYNYGLEIVMFFHSPDDLINLIFVFVSPMPFSLLWTKLTIYPNPTSSEKL